MTGDPYVYPGSVVLRNKCNLTDWETLEAFERQMVAQRTVEGIPPGKFDLAHLCAIHYHLFQDVYDWAGKVRTTELSKGGHQFMFRRYIARGMADVARRIAAGLPYSGLCLDEFAMEVGRVLGDINYVHPFREGNGRTQLQFLKQLCGAAGHPLDLRQLDIQSWIQASKSAHNADYDLMANAIRVALIRSAPAR